MLLLGMSDQDSIEEEVPYKDIWEGDTTDESKKELDDGVRRC